MVVSGVVCVETCPALGEVLREVWVGGTDGRLSARQEPQSFTFVRRCQLGQWRWDWYDHRGERGVCDVPRIPLHQGDAWHVHVDLYIGPPAMSGFPGVYNVASGGERLPWILLYFYLRACRSVGLPLYTQ